MRSAARSTLAAAAALAATAPFGHAASGDVAGAPSGSVVLERLSFRRGHVTVEMPRVEARGTPLDADALREILDPSSPLDLGQRLTRLSAASLAMPEVVLYRDAEPNAAAPQAVIFHDVLLTDVQAGKAAALSVRAVEGKIDTGDPTLDTVSVGAIAAHALDPQLMLQIATGSRSDEELPVSPVLHDLSIDGVKLTDHKGNALELGRFETGIIGGRPLLDTPTHLLRQVQDGQVGFKPDASDPLYRAMADAGESFKLERLKVSSTSFAAPDGTGFRLATFTLDGDGPARIPSMELDGAALDAAGVHISMKSAALSGSGTGTVFTRASALLMGRVAAPAVPVAPDAAGAVEFKVADVHIALPPVDGGPFPPGTVNTVDIPSIAFGESAAAGGAAIEAHQSIEVRYDIPPGGDDPVIQNLRDLGLSHIDATFGYRVSYDATGHAIRLDELALGAKGVGGATLTASMGDVPDAPFRPGLTADDAAERFADATVHDVTLTLVDEGFLARALPAMARQAGTSAAMLRAGLKTKVDLALPDLLGQTPAEAAVARAIDAFIDAGGTLKLAARSADGVSVDEIAGLSDPSDALKLFDLTAVGPR